MDYLEPLATAFNEQLVGGKTSTLIKEMSETNLFGRLLRYVIVGGFFINYELVRHGFATAVTFLPDVAGQEVLRKVEKLAR